VVAFLLSPTFDDEPTYFTGLFISSIFSISFLFLDLNCLGSYLSSKAFFLLAALSFLIAFISSGVLPSNSLLTGLLPFFFS